MDLPPSRLLALAGTALLWAGCDSGHDDAVRAGLPRSAPEAWVELVDAERTFAGDARARGGRTAFMEHISPSGVLFRPGPVPGLDALQAGPEFPGSLAWAPAYAHISGDGDLGFTTGPYRFSPDDGSPPGTGWYTTVWRRRADGDFHFEVDVGVPAPTTGTLPDTVLALGPLYPVPPEPRPDHRGLLAVDESYGRSYASSGTDGLGGLRVHPGVLLLRQGQAPATGVDAVLEAAVQTSGAGGLLFQAEGSGSADDGSLGYVYGMAVRPSPGGAPVEGDPAFPFLHIWRRLPDGGWELLLDLLGVAGA